MTKKIAAVDRNGCVACGVCMKACFQSAIQVWKGCWAEVDKTKCVGCGKCGKACPSGCISCKVLEVSA